MSALDFKYFYEENYSRSFYFVKSYVHDNMVAEDIVLEALMKCWEIGNSGTSVLSIPFLFTILKNKSLNYLKQEIIRQRTHDTFCEKSERELSLRLSFLNECDPQDIFSSEIQSIIDKTLSSLPKQTRQVFEMSRFENRPAKEIAEKAGISVKGVEYHITRALRNLRVALKDYLPLFYLLFLK